MWADCGWLSTNLQIEWTDADFHTGGLAVLSMIMRSIKATESCAVWQWLQSWIQWPIECLLQYYMQCHIWYQVTLPRVPFNMISPLRLINHKRHSYTDNGPLQMDTQMKPSWSIFPPKKSEISHWRSNEIRKMSDSNIVILTTCTGTNYCPGTSVLTNQNNRSSTKGCDGKPHKQNHRLVNPLDNYKCTWSIDGNHTYTWSNNYTWRKASKCTL